MKFLITADLDTFTEEILNGKLHFLCSDCILNSPNFFPRETFFPETIINLPGKEDVEMYSKPSRTSKTELFAVNVFHIKLHLKC